MEYVFEYACKSGDKPLIKYVMSKYDELTNDDSLDILIENAAAYSEILNRTNETFGFATSESVVLPDIPKLEVDDLDQSYIDGYWEYCDAYNKMAMMGLKDKGLMDTKFRSSKSYSGIDTDVLKSALQKYVRRNELDKLLWCAAELDLFSSGTPRTSADGGMTTGKNSITTNFLHRLMIIYLEDVGIAEVKLWPLLHNLLCMTHIFGVEGNNAEMFRKRQTRSVFDYLTLIGTCNHTRMLSHINTAICKLLVNPTEFKINSVNQLSEKWPHVFNFTPHYPKMVYPTIHYPLIADDINSLLGCLETSIFKEEGQRASDMAYYWAYLITLKCPKLPKKIGLSMKPEFLIFDIIKNFISVYYPGDHFLENIYAIAVMWFKEISSLKEAFLCYFMLIAVLLNPECRDKDQHQHNQMSICDVYHKNIRTNTRVFTLHSVPVMTIDSYAIDMHTKQGKNNGANKALFGTQGSLVSNEVFFGNEVYKGIYDALKLGLNPLDDTTSGIISQMVDQPILLSQDGQLTGKVIDFAIEYPFDPSEDNTKESDLFLPLIRAQLVTSESKQDTYYAIDKRSKGKVVFVKGPYLDQNAITSVVGLHNVKGSLFPELNVIPIEIVTAIVDLYPNTPLGIRKKAYGNQCYFLVFENKYKEKVNVITRSSKLWPLTEVVDSRIICPVMTLINTDEQGFCQYLLNIIFRYIIGVPDLADRNFLYIKSSPDEIQGSMIYSVDEEGYGRDVNMKTSLKTERCKLILNYININEEWVQQVLVSWYNNMSQNEDYILSQLPGLMLSDVYRRMNIINNKESRSLLLM